MFATRVHIAPVPVDEKALRLSLMGIRRELFLAEHSFKKALSNDTAEPFEIRRSRVRLKKLRKVMIDVNKILKDEKLTQREAHANVLTIG